MNVSNCFVQKRCIVPFVQCYISENVTLCRLFNIRYSGKEIIMRLLKNVHLLTRVV